MSKTYTNHNAPSLVERYPRNVILNKVEKTLHTLHTQHECGFQPAQTLHRLCTQPCTPCTEQRFPPARINP